MLDEPADVGGQVSADAQNAKTMAVQERKSRVLPGDFLPELPHAEVPLAHIRVVQQHDSRRAQLGEPRGKVVLNGFVGVKPVDVEQVDGAVDELRQRGVELGPNHARERPEMEVVE